MESYDALAAVVSLLREDDAWAVEATLHGWTGARVALVGTGRAEPTAAERDAVAGLTVPVFS